MKTNNALKALAKKNILVLDVTSAGHQFNRRFTATVNGRRLTMTTQGEHVSTMRVATVSDKDDSQTDYMAGSYWGTMPQVFAAMSV